MINLIKYITLPAGSGSIESAGIYHHLSLFPPPSIQTEMWGISVQKYRYDLLFPKTALSMNKFKVRVR
jgi:hypothetical protein